MSTKYTGTIRILSWDNVQIKMNTLFIQKHVKDSREFAYIFESYCREYKPDFKGLKAVDYGFLSFDDPQRFESVVADILDNKRN